ncbi:putative membrane spanning protein [Roseomonas mucosa]|uniref:Putative membrane spanning protein n=1 Tax=Roseomonas mucosa TaxID=207340 RepID=A0A4Y1MYQ8_9PROT|nr:MULTISPECIES: lysylphosphatidylglycerol synthase domain-containing protein [Roseomonas]ATR20187.1 hypothetical protein CTJ15_07650 [Roseomonas sp. FDAARGOS_362]AWV22930.1 putative membrane spanning protein [Roseomonas mucosa]MDT8277172.1 lysylphosphatidylglycerol synthase domain-containing protein [Roseomonas mucosa]MDT8356378.1 lysylphosphatidylglycerol synthase domain-containing protein [Roseomonas mucosa]QDJ10246.1 putative membrane spanning protein [Roseomonas mucosa]
MIWSTALSLVIGLAAFLTLILTSDPAQILALLLQTGWGLLLVAALHVPQIFCSALGWQPLIEDSRRPGLLTLTKLRWVRESANAMLPFVQVAGELARAQLLLRRGVGRIRVVASIAVDLATEMASQIVFSLMGVAVLLLIPHEGGDTVTHWLIAATLLGGGLTVAFMLAQRFGLFRLVEKLLPRFAARAGWASLGDMTGLNEAVLRLYRQPSHLWRSGAGHLASWLIGVVETWAAMWLLGIEASFAEAMVIESLAQAVRSAGFFIPGALGVQEGGYVLLCGLFGIPADQALALALVRRLRDIALGLPGLVAWRLDASGPHLGKPALVGMAKPGMGKH